MNFLSSLLVVIWLSFLLAGCMSPNNTNDINININEQGKSDSLLREMNRNCVPKTKCPHLWRYIEEQCLCKP